MHNSRGLIALISYNFQHLLMPNFLYMNILLLYSTPQFIIHQFNHLVLFQQAYVCKKSLFDKSWFHMLYIYLILILIKLQTCFFRQFGRSVVRADYLTLRKGFIMVCNNAMTFVLGLNGQSLPILVLISVYLHVFLKVIFLIFYLNPYLTIL